VFIGKSAAIPISLEVGKKIIKNASMDIISYQEWRKSFRLFFTLPYENIVGEQCKCFDSEDGGSTISQAMIFYFNTTTNIISYFPQNKEIHHFTKHSQFID